MQNISFTITHLTGRGWRDTSGNGTVDETIGLKAGRDEYSTARGTVMGWARNNLILVNGTEFAVKVEGELVAQMVMRHGKWEHQT